MRYQTMSHSSQVVKDMEIFFDKKGKLRLRLLKCVICKHFNDELSLLHIILLVL